MSNRYDVERMLNRLVEKDEDDGNLEKAVYSWQRDKDYRDKKTEDMSVDDIISTIGPSRGKHEAVRRRRNDRTSADTHEHSVKQKIVYRSPEEIQEEVDKQDNVDSKEYLNRMLDRMEKEIAAMENPLKPKISRNLPDTENAPKVPKREKNVIKVKVKKKDEVLTDKSEENIVQADDQTENTTDLEVSKPDENVPLSVEKETPETVPVQNAVENIAKSQPDEAIKADPIENVKADDQADDYDLLDEENIRIEQEIKDFSNGLLDDIDGFSNVDDISENKSDKEPKKKKGFFSKLFSKKEKSEETENTEENVNADGLYDFDEEEFNKKFDELSRQTEELQNDYSGDFVEPEDMSEDDYFFEEEEPKKINISDPFEPDEADAEVVSLENETDENIPDAEENHKEQYEDLMDEKAAAEFDVTENTENSADDEEIFIESVRSDEKKIVTNGKLKQKKYMCFGFFVTVFAVIGFVAVIYIAGGTLLKGVRGSSIKSQINSVVYPVVAEDISPFNDISECSDKELIGAALLNILMNDDVTVYGNDSETLTIPSLDVEKSAVELFGSDAKIKEHQNAVIDNTTFYYDKVTGVYSVTAKPLIYTSKPYVSKLTSNGDDYTAKVLYMTDYPDWIEKRSNGQSYYNKICTYTLKRDDNRNFYIVAMTEDEMQ